jgi:hypothetical protein
MRVMSKNKKSVDHSGSTLDSLLEEDGILAEVEAVAVKRVIAWQLREVMKADRITASRHQPLPARPAAQPAKTRRCSSTPSRARRAWSGSGCGSR